MVDYSKIRSNMERMVAEGATEQEIDAYASEAGLAGKEASPPNWAMRAVGAVGDAATGAYEAVKGAYQGKTDPRYEALGGFTGENLNLDDFSRINRSKFTSAGMNDASYGDIVKSTLGQRLKGVEKDKHGQEILKYTDDSGADRSEYLNKPGLDGQDVDRFISSAIPYVASAGAVGRFFKGAPLLGRMALQGGAAGLTSVGMDAAARQMGSEQPISPGQAGMAAAFGAGGEAASAAAGGLYRHFKPSLFDSATGTLTEAGLKKARGLGLDPDAMTPEMMGHIDEIAGAANPAEAATAVQSKEFNIPITKGQRTKDPEFLRREEEMRRSLLGPDAREIITDFDTVQKSRISEGVEKIRGTVAPTGASTPIEAGGAFADAFKTAKDASKVAEREAWEKVPTLYPAEGAVDTLGPALQKNFSSLGFLPDERLTPAAHKQIMLLTDYAGGKPIQQPYSLLGEREGRPSIDEVRRRLLGMGQSALTGQDKAASKAIYDGFNSWIDDLGKKGQFLDAPASQGGAASAPMAAEQLVAARTFTKEQRALFAQRGHSDAAGRILEDLATNGDTPERIVQSLFGASPQVVPRKGAVEAIKRLRQVFSKNDPEALDQVKAALWLSMTRGKNGEVLSPGNLRNALDKTFENKGSLLGELFSAEERSMMRRFRDAVDATTYVPPNASGTSYALAAQKKEAASNMLGTLLRRGGASATFQGKPARATLLYGLAKHAPDIGGIMNATSKQLARNAIGQTVKKKKNSSPLFNALLEKTALEYSGDE